MSLSFSTALSGLSAASTDLAIIGNNIANANTTGFKFSRAEFAEIYGSALRTTIGGRVGSGVRVAAIAQQFNQGSLNNTNNSLDLAISGDGFFRMTDVNGGNVVYTRNGAFHIDKDNYIVNAQDQRLSAYQADATTNRVNLGRIGSLYVDQSDIAPQSTTAVNPSLNISSTSPIVDTTSVNWNLKTAPPTPATTTTVSSALRLNSTSSVTTWVAPTAGAAPAPSSYNYATETKVYDNAVPPVAHNATMYFVKTSPDTWDTHTFIDGAEVIPTNTTGATASLTFDNTGGLSPASAQSGQFTYTLGTGSVTLDISRITQNSTPIAPDATTYSYTTSTTVYDSQGSSHVASLYFSKVGPNSWDVHTFMDGWEINTVNPPATKTTLNFNTNGTLVSTVPATPAGLLLGQVGYSSPLTNGAAPIDFTLDLAPITQYGGPSSVANVSQNGYTTGHISSIEVDKEGVISTRFTNGQSRVLGQIALTSFNNVQGLRPNGDTEWTESGESGPARVGTAGTAGRGAVQSGVLEASNVDLTAQLVNMIVSQRNFQSNAQVVSAVDTLTQTIVNLR